MRDIRTQEFSSVWKLLDKSLLFRRIFKWRDGRIKGKVNYIFRRKPIKVKSAYFWACITKFFKNQNSKEWKRDEIHDMKIIIWKVSKKSWLSPKEKSENSSLLQKARNKNIIFSLSFFFNIIQNVKKLPNISRNYRIIDFFKMSFMFAIRSL